MGWAIWNVAHAGLFRLMFPDGTEFLVDHHGRRVWAVWPAPLTLEDTATYLLGPVMGFVLALRRVICLHSSAAAIGGRAVALVGPSGVGKSTLATALAQRGMPVLTDDIVALCGNNPTGEFLVAPGYPRLRLWPDSVRILYGQANVLPLLTPNWDKCFADLTGPEYSFQAQPLPLGAVYLLGVRKLGPGPSIVPVAGQDALVALTANRYFPLPGKDSLADAFSLLGRLVAHVPVRRVTPHLDPAHLPRLCDMLLDDFRQLSTVS
jgi:hypothetical protein